MQLPTLPLSRTVLLPETHLWTNVSGARSGDGSMSMIGDESGVHCISYLQSTNRTSSNITLLYKSEELHREKSRPVPEGCTRYLPYEVS